MAAELTCRLAIPVEMLANKEPTRGMLLSDIRSTRDVMAVEVGSYLLDMQMLETEIKILVLIVCSI